jgi:pimeloyl-ACP methyl ester carboxylesterase
MFEQRFTVYAMDRRGRGASGDGPEYAMEREYEDITAVLEHIGRPASVIGHSYGAGCALEAALLTDRIEKLVLYEPGVLEGASGYYESEPVTAALRKAEDELNAGEREQAILTILREVLGVAEDDIQAVKNSPTWPQRVTAAPTVLREIQGEAAYRFDPARYRDLKVPALLVTGSESPAVMRDGTAALHAALPNSRVAVLQGQGHVAITTAPDLFAREVMGFLVERS